MRYIVNYSGNGIEGIAELNDNLSKAKAERALSKLIKSLKKSKLKVNWRVEL